MIEKIHSDDLPLHNKLRLLQDSFSYIFIDVDITLLKFIEQYLYHIFIVSDMNPFNLAGFGQNLIAEDMVAACISRTSFIINKYYKGELSTRNILQGIIWGVDAPRQLQELMVYANTYEIPYDQKIYLKWMYSFYGEPLDFKKLDGFERAISNTISKTILPQKRKKSRFQFL
jgi:serine/threonine-protein kinase